MNTVDANKKNRWICTTPNQIKLFKKTMLIVSATALLTLILLYFFGGTFRFLYADLIIDITDREAIITIKERMMKEELVMLANNIATMCISIFSVVLTALFFMFLTGGSEKNSDSYISLKPKFPKYTLILIVVGLSIVYFFAYLSDMFDETLRFVFGIEKYASAFYGFPRTPAGVIVYFISIVITPSLFEEFMFRYLMLNALQKYGNAFAIVVTSVLFGFIHGSTSAFFFATALGMFSAYIAIKTKSIWFSVVLHAAVNSVAMIMEYVGSRFSMNKSYFFNLVYIDFIFAISIIATFMFIKKNKKLELAEHKNHVHIKRRIKIFGFLNLISVLFFVIVILISAGDYYLL